MSDLDQYFSVTLNKSNQAVGQAGYGLSCLVGHQSYWPELTRKFSEPDDMVTLGMPVTHPIYKMASALYGPEPRPSGFMVGTRRETPTVHSIDLTPSTPVAGEVYSFSISLDGVLVTTVSVTGDATPTVGEICTAITAALGSVTDVTPTDNATDVTVAADNAGAVLDIRVLTPKNLTVDDAATTDPGIATDLAAILADDPSFFFVHLDRQSKAEVLAAGPWCLTNKKVLVASLGNSAVKNGTAGNAALTLQAATNTACLLDFSDAPGAYPGIALTGKQSPKQPGGTNWAWQVVPGAVASVLSAADATNLEAANCNYFRTINGVVSYYDGKTSGGEWIDVNRGGAWMQSRTQERIHAMQLNADKVGFTADGLSKLENQLLAQHQDGVRAGVIDGRVPVVITIPTIDDHSSSDFGARTTQLIKMRSRLAGAINKTNVEISLYQ